MRRAERALPIRHAVALGLLQGPTELLPVSSSAHTTLVPWLAGWDYAELDDELRKGFEVALHAGTAAALALLAGAELAADGGASGARGGCVLVLALAPPALAGLALGRTVERDLGGPPAIALRARRGLRRDARAEAARARAGRARVLPRPGALDGLALGLAQAIALIPGVSRSGATISAARWRGFGRADAYRLSWTVALPVIAGAATLQGAAAAAGRRGGAAARGDGRRRGRGVLLDPRSPGRCCAGGRASGPLAPFALYRGALAAWVVLRAGARR